MLTLCHNSAKWQLQDVKLTLLKMKKRINYTNFIPKLNKNFYFN